MAIVTNVTTPITQTNITEPPISIVSTTTNNVTSSSAKQEDNVTSELINIEEDHLSNVDNTTAQQDLTSLTNVTEVTQKSLLPNNITSGASDNNTILNDSSSDTAEHIGEGNQNDSKIIKDGDAFVQVQEVAEHSEFILTQPLFFSTSFACFHCDSCLLINFYFLYIYCHTTHIFTQILIHIFLICMYRT